MECFIIMFTGEWKKAEELNLWNKSVYIPEAFRASIGPIETNYTMILARSLMYAVYVRIYKDLEVFFYCFVKDEST